MKPLLGYVRENGEAGIRNHVLVIGTVCCVNEAVDLVAAQSPGAIAIKHAYGCDKSRSAHFPESLRNTCINPNVYAVVLLALGCDGIDAASLAAQIGVRGVRVCALTVQDEGGSARTVQKAADRARQFLSEARAQPRVVCPPERICAGIVSERKKDIAKLGRLIDLYSAQGFSIIVSRPSLEQIHPFLDRGWSQLPYGARALPPARHHVQVCREGHDEAVAGLFASGAQFCVDLRGHDAYQYPIGPVCHVNVNCPEETHTLAEAVRALCENNSPPEGRFVNSVMCLPRL